MYCRKCGTKMDDSAAFCIECGELTELSREFETSQTKTNKFNINDIVITILIFLFMIIVVTSCINNTNNSNHSNNASTANSYKTNYNYNTYASSKSNYQEDSNSHSVRYSGSIGPLYASSKDSLFEQDKNFRIEVTGVDVKVQYGYTYIDVYCNVTNVSRSTCEFAAYSSLKLENDGIIRDLGTCKYGSGEFIP